MYPRVPIRTPGTARMPVQPPSRGDRALPTTPPARAAPFVGQQVSHYHILELMSEGGAGAVYKAQDLALGRAVAIKIIRPDAGEPSLATTHFLREAQAVARIEHPNVVAIHDVIESRSEYFLVMQFVDGVSLREWLRGRRTAVEEAIAFARQIGSGLAAAHERGVVHRDLKPENVMVGSDGQCRILDFGIAHLVGHSTLSGRERIVGTIPYMAPEQVRGEAADPRTDVYALGVVLFEMLAGRLPFESDEYLALFYDVLHRDPPDLGALRDDLPAELTRVVHHALAKDRERRYHDMNELLRDLEVVRGRISRPALAPGRLLARARLSPWRTAWAGAAVLAALGVGGFLAFHGGGRGVPVAPRVLVARWEGAGPGAEEDWLGPGIMDGLIRSLGASGGVQVVSRHAVAAMLETLRPADAEARRAAPMTVARRLGARYLVSGTVQTAGRGARISCELTDVRTGVLAKSWTRDLADLRSDFSPAVDALATQIAAELGGTARRPATAVPALTASFDALASYQRGLEHVEVKDVADALVDLREAVALDSTFVDAHLQLAMVTPEQAEREREIAIAVRHASRAPPLTRLHVEAEHQLLQRRTLDAIRTYHEILALDPEDVRARRTLASLYMFRRQFDVAVAQLTLLHQLNPSDYSFYPAWWVAYVEIGRRDKGLALLRAWRAELPREPAPIRELVRFDEEIGDYRAGLALCDTLDALAPGSAAPLRGLMLYYLGRLREEEAIYRRLASVPDPSFPASRAYSWLAQIACRRGRYDDGLQLIDRALEQQPETYNFWIAGLLAAGKRDTARVATCLAQIAARFTALPDSATEAFSDRRFYYHLQGMDALEGHDHERAVASFRRALAYTSLSDDPFFRTSLGRALLEAGRPARAIEELERVTARNPNYPEALLYLGRAYAETRQARRARAALDRLGGLWKDADTDDPLNLERKRWQSLVQTSGPAARLDIAPAPGPALAGPPSRTRRVPCTSSSSRARASISGGSVAGSRTPTGTSATS